MAENPFSFFDFSEEDVVEVNEEMKLVKGERDGRICICGHAVKRHGGQEIGVTYCSPSRMTCPCKNIRVVLDTQDTRDFLRKTVGSGPMHALGRGIQTAMEKSHKVEWLIPAVCDRCETAGPLSPVPVSQQGQVAIEATGWDALLCRKCRSEV
jgi:hypothetical protein